jgi:L-fucono-1,5-lactonase
LELWENRFQRTFAGSPLKSIKSHISKSCFGSLSTPAGFHRCLRRYKEAGEIVNTTAGRIDAHHHLWRYTPEEYGWIGEQMGVLRRDFLPYDLKALLDRAGIAGAIAVQARQSLEETRWLLRLAEQPGDAAWMKGVVGWAPIAAADFSETLAQLRQSTGLKGVGLRGLRHVIQDEPDDQFILGEAFNRGIRVLRDTGLVYDILIHARHLPQTVRFVDMHPSQLFVLDHCAKPAIAAGELEPWAAHMRELARRPNVCCKLSGLVTEADWQRWTPASLEPYWRVVLEAFGPSRLLFGSDWPVALLATSYQRWVDTVTEWVAPLSTSEREAIWGGTASRVYSL